MKRPLMWLCILLICFNVVKVYIDEHGSPPVRLPETAVTLQGRIDSWEIKSEYTILYLSDVFFYDDSVKEITKNNLIGLRCYTEEIYDYKPGQQIAVQGFLALPESAGNAGGFDEARYYRSRGYDYILYETKVLKIGKKYDILLELLWQIRQYASKQINYYLQPDDAGIMRAMLLGDKTDMMQETKDLYQQTGVYHILSISGLHIALIAGGLYKMLKIMRLNPYVAAGISMIAIVLYGIMIGMPSSAFRAIVMFGFGLTATLLNRSHDRFTSLAVAGACLVGIEPFLILDAGVQLSFLAVLGIIGLYPTFLNIHSQHMKVADGVWVSFAVTYMTLPIIMRTYQEIPLYSLLANVCIIPLIPVLIGLGVVVVLSAGVFPWAAKITAWFIHIILLFYKNALGFINRIPGNRWITGAPELSQVLIFYGIVGMLTIVVLRTKRKLLLRSLNSENAYAKGQQPEYVKEQKIIRKMMLRMRLVQCMVMLFAVVILFLPKRFDCRITFLDVGQGDGICIEEQSSVYLIDCGSTSEDEIGEYTLIPFLKYEGINQIDGWFLTHPDSDHVSGFVDLCKRKDMYGIDVKAIYLPLVLKEEFAELIQFAQQQNIAVITLEKGDRISCRQMEFIVLSPEKDIFYKDENAASLVLYLQCNGFTGLFMGDGGTEAEKSITDVGVKSVTLLKVGHHGSAIESNSLEFIQEIKPELAVISCGENNVYGHPHEEVLKRLEAVGSRVCRTDQNGQISITIRGNRIRVTVFRD